jgi:hypothetical protein
MSDVEKYLEALRQKATLQPESALSRRHEQGLCRPARMHGRQSLEQACFQWIELEMGVLV